MPTASQNERSLQHKLRDPAYLDLHLTAVAVLKAVSQAPWYDAHFLRRYEAAKQYLSLVKPEKVQSFVDGFAPLHPPANFAPIRLTDIFTAAQHQRIRATVRNLPEIQIERHESEDFGRLIVHDHPYFLELQAELVPLVSRAAGRELATGYNFLSLYGGAGRCDPHMDEPISMYTLDFCIDQDVDWPIYFSPVVPWPEGAQFAGFDPDSLRSDPAIPFSAYRIAPGEALLFAGSSQWHYRDAIPAGGFSNLLFFHYYPAGCEGLVDPGRWAAHFAIPELAPLCDLIGEDYWLGSRRDRR